MSRPAGMLRGIDRSAFAVALGSRLRTRGVAVGLTAIEDLVAALAVAAPATRSRLYWTARICLVRRHADVPTFDALFAVIFDDAVLDMDPHARRRPVEQSLPGGEHNTSVPKENAEPEVDSGLPWATLAPIVASSDDAASLIAVPQRLPASLAGLPDTPFEHLSPQDMQQLGQWLHAVAQTWPTRRTRRVAIDHGGHRIALRPTIARSRRTGWETLELVCVTRVDKPRRVVMLCDVSQSMQAQAAAYLHLMRALALKADAEVFAFATSLTRLTAVLAHRSAEVAIEQASAKVGDRFGGTRIATNVQALLASHHADTVRGAIVLIGSDGWDSDPPERLAAAMARLRRRAHRVIWMNPRAAAPGFQPRVASMAAALPFCDQLLSADTFASLAQVIAELRTVSSRRVSSRASRGSRAGIGPG